MNTIGVVIVLLQLLAFVVHGMQLFAKHPEDTEVNSGQDAFLTCKIYRKTGQCSWQKDNKPVGIYIGKYEWLGNQSVGDCSLKILNAVRDYDEGEWVCQVTAANFEDRDALSSIPVKLIVRGMEEKPETSNEVGQNVTLINPTMEEKQETSNDDNQYVTLVNPNTEFGNTVFRVRRVKMEGPFAKLSGILGSTNSATTTTKPGFHSNPLSRRNYRVVRGIPHVSGAALIAGLNLFGSSVQKIAAHIDTNRNIVIQIGNRLDTPLLSPEWYVAVGKVSLAPTVILENHVDVAAFSKLSDTAQGTYGILCYEIRRGTTQRVAIFWKVPYNTDFYDMEYSVVNIEANEECSKEMYQYIYRTSDARVQRVHATTSGRALELTLPEEKIIIFATMSNSYRAVLRVEFMHLTQSMDPGYYGPV